MQGTAARRGGVAKAKKVTNKKREEVLGRIELYGLTQPKRTPLWRNFRKYGVKAPGTLAHISICEVCRAGGVYCEFKMGKAGTTTSMRNHVIARHRPEAEAMIAAETAQEKGGKTAAQSDAPPSIRDQPGFKVEPKPQALDPDDWMDAVVEFVVRENLPLSIVESPSFRRLCCLLAGRQVIMCKETLLARMIKNKLHLDKILAHAVEGETVSISSDGWSCGDYSYLGVTYHWICKNWLLHSLSADIVKIEGTTTGEALSEKLDDAYSRRKVKKVWFHRTDCEPSMVKAGRIKSKKFPWGGCCCHRLESTTKHAFKGPGVCDMTCKCRNVATHFEKSTQGKKRLHTVCELKGIKYLKVMQDVKTRWWSTCCMLESCWHLRPALETILEGGVDEDVCTQRCSRCSWTHGSGI